VNPEVLITSGLAPFYNRYLTISLLSLLAAAIKAVYPAVVLKSTSALYF